MPQFTIESYDNKKHSESIVKKLLSYAVYNPTLEKLTQVLEQYQHNLNQTLFLAIYKHQILGILGVDFSGVILHIATDLLYRKQGVARQMIEKKSKDFSILTAQTDQEGVGFYQSCGFEIESLGQLYPGVERFRCIKNR